MRVPAYAASQTGAATDAIARELRMNVNIAVIGAQWGDEGKGKIVDLLTSHVSIVARYQGGHNAGHTVNVGDAQYILHLLPSGILHPDVRCVIGNGVVVDPDALLSEIDTLAAQGVEVGDRLLISDLLVLVAYVDRAGRVLADQHHRQARNQIVRGLELGHRFADPAAQVRGKGLAVDYLGIGHEYFSL